MRYYLLINKELEFSGPGSIRAGMVYYLQIYDFTFVLTKDYVMNGASFDANRPCLLFDLFSPWSYFASWAVSWLMASF